MKGAVDINIQTWIEKLQAVGKNAFSLETLEESYQVIPQLV